MDQLIEALRDWNIILQGAIGSALFYLFLKVGQKTTSYFLDNYKSFSKKTRIRQLREKIFRYSAINTKDIHERTYYATILWYRASRHFIKGMIWMTLGLAFSFLLPVLGIVGFIGTLYYLFLALEIVKGINYDGDVTEKINEINKELKELESTE